MSQIVNKLLTSKIPGMLYKKFVKISSDSWNNYFSLIYQEQKNGSLTPATHGPLYPYIILLTDCPGYYVMELLGAQPIFSGLKVKHHKQSSINEYFGQFDSNHTAPGVRIDNCTNLLLRGLLVTQSDEFDLIKKRFPMIENYNVRLINNGGTGTAVHFSGDVISGLENCIIVNHKKPFYRCKHILAAYVCSKNISPTSLQSFYDSIFESPNVQGVSAPKNKNTNRSVIASQLQSMYLLPGLHETTIGEFINGHKEIIYKAFSTDHFYYEPYLQWIDGSSMEGENIKGFQPINPDLFIRRDDHFYDICDLKTAALKKPKITKGRKSRRRFIDYVAEGFAQLAHYRDYFNYPLNAEYAKNKYNIQIRNPRLILIVGSYENASRTEIEEACRQYSNTLEIIDYDTLAQLYLTAP